MICLDRSPARRSDVSEIRVLCGLTGQRNKFRTGLRSWPSISCCRH